jgi:hypothetical protein
VSLMPGRYHALTTALSPTERGRLWPTVFLGNIYSHYKWSLIELDFAHFALDSMLMTFHTYLLQCITYEVGSTLGILQEEIM